jgi:hypothetical protein
VDRVLASGAGGASSNLAEGAPGNRPSSADTCRSGPLASLPLLTRFDLRKPVFAGGAREEIRCLRAGWFADRGSAVDRPKSSLLEAGAEQSYESTHNYAYRTLRGRAHTPPRE